MASAKEIRNHIQSVRDTRKITNAMYMISSAKLRKVKYELDRTRPYFDALKTEIKRIFRYNNNGISSVLLLPDGSGAEARRHICVPRHNRR